MPASEGHETRRDAAIFIAEITNRQIWRMQTGKSVQLISPLPARSLVAGAPSALWELRLRGCRAALGDLASWLKGWGQRWGGILNIPYSARLGNEYLFINTEMDKACFLWYIVNLEVSKANRIKIPSSLVRILDRQY